MSILGLNHTLVRLIALFRVAANPGPQDMSDYSRDTLLRDMLIETSAGEHGPVYELTERGRAFVEYIIGLPLPDQVTAWRMPGGRNLPTLAESRAAWERDAPRPAQTADVLRNGAAGNLHPASADSAADDTPPPPPPKPKPIHGVTPAADPDERMRQAGQLLERGFGLNEVAETLEMDAHAIDRHFYPGGP